MTAPPAEPEMEIAVILDAWPRILPIPKGATDFDFSGDRFVDVGLGAHNGFYDFLRSRSGAVLGVRYTPDIDADALLPGILGDGGLGFVNYGQMRALLMFWGEERNFDPETSSDLYFGDNAIYRATGSGRLAIAFNIDLLSPAERASLPGLAGSVRK